MNIGKKVLICDVEEGIRESLKLILANDYPLFLTNSGAQCLEFLANAKDIGLVLLDIKISQINGLDILKQIKEKYPKLNVIIITGYKSVETTTVAVNHGAAGYIVKPFQTEEILETVKRNFK